MSHQNRGLFPLTKGDWIIAETEKGIVPTLEGYKFAERILGAFVPKGGTLRTIGARAIDAEDGTHVVAMVTWGYENDHDRTLQLDPAIWRELNDPSAALVFEAMAEVLSAIPERSEIASIHKLPLAPQAVGRAA